ncbi:(2,3-dihydroxybenzoyl)adenylate synthase [Streptomonospora wellingtoniae]|uniref:(2,3-dihydroxybenzoyl)adenylate synthase n=1 Tax=Streptomonospora wellingtoniae TaxID=3075544 RepID=A0ABU2L0P7_9ACTN|nr:(2,3-dihydroxybenzoyl)adenylate synthase [Streptomonospora sp. DSM 45055]MDT0305129.1 (2,3-dihydroxybenzoyl)adenylate synthase [Streptomonospora sp. DSM 45055]
MLAGCTPWPAEFAERYRRRGYWRGETLGAFLRDRADRFADRTAVVGAGKRWSYAELDTRADRMAAGLARLGIGAGDRVVVQLPNRPEVFEVAFALFRLGALPVYALPAHRRAEISYLCSFTEAAALVVADTDAGFDYRELAERVRTETGGPEHILVAGDTGGRAHMRPLEEVRAGGGAGPGTTAGPDPAEVAFLQLSGGTTGLPKLIPRTHDDYLYSVRASAEICELDPGTVYLAALPVVHNFPMSSPGFLGVFSAGGTVVLAPDPSPATCLAAIEAEGVTHTAVVPPVAMLWLDAVDGGSQAHRDLTSLRVLQVGGAKFNPEAARRVRPTLGCTLQQVFGMAEGLVNYTRHDDPEEVVVATQGRPISPDDEIRVVDSDGTEVAAGGLGELQARGPYTIRGYYRAPEHNARAFTADGFYRTGDLVRATPTGHIVVEGRAKDQINRGGEKIAPDEVEDHLLAHPGVHDAAVVAVPDRFLGERTCAYVVPRGAEPARSELLAFLRERGLAAYKIPDRLEFVDAFPATGVGKVSRRELREAVRAAHAPAEPGAPPPARATAQQ